MKKIEKLDLYLTQLIQNTNNRKKDNDQVNIGRINEYLIYINNNPLSTKITKNDLDLFEYNTLLDPQNKFDIQYINRIYNTPFYVSQIYYNDYSLKIIDFYDWHKQTSIYRLFILKRLNYKSNSESIKLSFDFNKDINKISENRIQINEVIINFSQKYHVEKNIVAIEQPIKSNTTTFAYVLNFDKENIEGVSIDDIVNKFHELFTKCKSNDISNFFLTRNFTAEKELDELWNKQKIILPDLTFDTNLTTKKSNLPIIKYWIKDFYHYFNIDNKLEAQNTYLSKDNNKKFNSDSFMDNIPSKSEILNFYLLTDFQDKDGHEKIQKWWNVYSLPIFENAFETKCKSDPEEVFAVYFLAIFFKLPWANILFIQIEKSLLSLEFKPFHDFLFLISFFYKRILKKTSLSNITHYSPGYYWDNNYKSIIGCNSSQQYEITKFSDRVYVKILKGNNFKFKINKLCRLSFEEKNNIIIINPLIDDRSINFKLSKSLKISIDEYTINFPLVWEKGLLEFNYLKLKWILKKNRFQFTLNSSEKKTIYLNDEIINLAKEKKLIHYLPVIQNTPQICLKLFNDRGGSHILKQGLEVSSCIVSGFAIARYGTITNNILFSKNIRKQKLFTNSSDSTDERLIQLDKYIDKINFYIKYSEKSLIIPYIPVDIIAKFVYLNFLNSQKLILNIDSEFSENISIILNFFNNIFGFKPEYYIINENLKSPLISNMIIKFLYKKDMQNTEEYNFEGRNQLVLTGDNIPSLLQRIRELLKINIINSIN